MSSEFGACLDDSVSREFVGDPVVHEQVEDGEFEYPPANKVMKI